MRLEKIKNHIALNEIAVKQFSKNWVTQNSLSFMPKDSIDRLSRIENKATGYVARFGDKSMLVKNMKQDSQSPEHLYLLLKIGMAIDKKDVLEKALNITGEKNIAEDIKINKMKHENEQEIKDCLVQIENYYINQRLVSTDDQLPEVQQQFNIKKSIAISPIVNKPIENLKLKEDFLAHMKMVPKKKIIFKKINTEDLDDDFDQDLENTELFTSYLSDERIEQEIEFLARKDFHLKEVASNQKTTSLDGDIPRAVITNLSFSAIDNIVQSMDKRFNQPNMSKPLKKSSAMTPKPSFLKINKPTPDKLNKIKIKSLKQQEMAKRAQQKTLEISKRFMFNQENHLNYVDIERFELDEMQGRNFVYEAGARNPLSGRIFSSKVKTAYSDLRMDNQYKVRR